MNDLQRLQQQFQRYVLHGTADIAPHIAGANASERLAVYAEAYRLRLVEALQTDFDALRAVLGDAGFADMAHAYLAAHPSTHPSLRELGRQLPGFLARDERYRAHALLADLAAFDWALTEAFDAPDAEVLAHDTLAAIPAARWPYLRFTPHPSLFRLDIHWNAAALWHAQNNDAPLPAAERAPHPIAWAVWRQGLHTYFRSLPVSEAWALDAVRAGHDFAFVCEGVCEWIDPTHAAAHAAGLLKQWLADGMLSRIASA